MIVEAPSIPVERFTENAFDWQIEAMEAFDAGLARMGYLICHRRARKTTLAINLAIREACRHPNSTYRYIAPTRVAAKGIVWDDPFMLFAHLPPKGLFPWKANTSDLTVKFHNGSRLVLEGADKITESHRGKGGQGFIFDEWSYHESPAVWFNVFRPIVAEGDGRWAWFLFTPNGMNHAYDMYSQALANADGETFCRVLKASQSGIMDPRELEKAKAEMPLPLYMQEFECEFLMSSDMVLIQPAQIERLKTVNHPFAEERRIISCDPAFGGDQCVIMVIHNTKIMEKKVMHPDRTSEIVGELTIAGSRWDTHNYVIDTIGNGKGVCDGMSEIQGNYVLPFNSSEASSRDKKPLMANRRAEAWWHTMEQIVACNVAPIEDKEVRKQLTQVCYKLSGSGAIQMELKDKVKKRLGRSPDDADCYVYGQWGLQHVDPVTRDGRPINNSYVPAAARAGSWVA